MVSATKDPTELKPCWKKEMTVNPNCLETPDRLCVETMSVMNETRISEMDPAKVRLDERRSDTGISKIH